MLRVAWTIPLALIAFCDDPTPAAIEIPSEVHGFFGRDASDLELGTVGLEIDAGALRFSEMTLTVTDGKLVGSTFQISRAEVRWKKDDAEKLPKLCKGTLARQDARLLISLFKMDSDEPCESILKGEWTEWRKVTEFPETMRGVFGGSDAYAPSTRLTIDAKEIRSSEGEPPFVLEEAIRFVNQDAWLIVTAGKQGDLSCKGNVGIENGELIGQLGDCDAPYGKRWTLEDKAIPTKPLANRKVTATFADGKVTLANDAGTRCTQTILRTAPRSTTDSARDQIPVLAGQVLLLETAEPEGGAACADRIENLYQAECRARFGAPCAEEELPVAEPHCPTHLVVGDPTTEGRKMALLGDVSTVACFDMTGQFQEK